MEKSINELVEEIIYAIKTGDSAMANYFLQTLSVLVKSPLNNDQ
jgi:hypothetical protein